ncbi:MAG: argininosuccinate lyase [Candidatus Wolframiiraptor sp. EX4484-121]|nr:MAG: argininosuccinate lyase [Candidatus Wolframiiraptor sp. EX4484-121]
MGAGLGSGIYRSRLGEPLDEEAARFLSSLKDDSEIFLEDILGSEAHAIMLYEQGIISRADLEKILRALEEIKGEWLGGDIDLKAGEFEDVHEFIEARLIEMIGVEVGGKLHTGRSRNDQVALDIRLRTRRYLLELWSELLNLMEAILIRAEEEKDTPLMLYTHLQHAQIGSLPHYLLALFDHLYRDLERLEECYRRVNKSPLGASAIGGSSLPLDRSRVAELLGFDGVVENSIDAVSSRDFALESLSIASILATFLSRISEDLIIWSSSEFGYVELPDKLASPSSIMPHKKNPCVLELVRARAGRVCGLLTASLMELKGVPTGYNRDLQDQKRLIFEALKEVQTILRIFSKVVKEARFEAGRIYEIISGSYAPAIDLAESMVKHLGISVREAHMIVGEIVRRLVDEGVEIKDLDLEMIREVSRRVLGRDVDVPEEVLEVVKDPLMAVARRRTLGSPNPGEISKMIKDRWRILGERRRVFQEVFGKIHESEERLERTVKSFIGGE